MRFLPTLASFASLALLLSPAGGTAVSSQSELNEREVTDITSFLRKRQLSDRAVSAAEKVERSGFSGILERAFSNAAIQAAETLEAREFGGILEERDPQFGDGGLSGPGTDAGAGAGGAVGGLGRFGGGGAGSGGGGAGGGLAKLKQAVDAARQSSTGGQANGAAVQGGQAAGAQGSGGAAADVAAASSEAAVAALAASSAAAASSTAANATAVPDAAEGGTLATGQAQVVSDTTSSDAAAAVTARSLHRSRLNRRGFPHA
ncbi:hypothetical protein JCM10213_002943 [Rhodosporidiobolus nylandii]